MTTPCGSACGNGVPDAVFRAALAFFVMGTGFMSLSAEATAPMSLSYFGRYNLRFSTDHLTGVEGVMSHHALVSTNHGVALVDLDSLYGDGHSEPLDLVPLIDASNTYTRDDGYVYVNERLGGISILWLDSDALTLSMVARVFEPGVFFEKMCLYGDRLYVAAHAYGMRIYDLADPSRPVLVGTLETGLDDAFAVAVDGTTAYVADGAGGLKIVDISDETAPVIVAGETTDSAAGTAQDVIVIGDDVYVASGGAGVAHYAGGDPARRVLFDTPIAAEEMAVVGDYLAVTDLGGVQVFGVEPDGSLTLAAGEFGSRRSWPGAVHPSETTLRAWHGVGVSGDDRLLVADWDSMDVYELIPPQLNAQPDIVASTQRLRFSPAGGESTVRITNNGSVALEIAGVSCTRPQAYTAVGLPSVIQPGRWADLTVRYVGHQGISGLVLIESNDPDESPLPIQVFGQTVFVDPGEPAAPFVLEAWTYDRAADRYEREPFDFDFVAGRVVYLWVFGTW